MFFALLGLMAVFSTGTTQASIITYTNRAAFISQLQPGYFEDTFAGVAFGDISGASATRSPAMAIP